jgi:hypothetical protein
MGFASGITPPLRTGVRLIRRLSKLRSYAENGSSQECDSARVWRGVRLPKLLACILVCRMTLNLDSNSHSLNMVGHIHDKKIVTKNLCTSGSIG